MGRPITEEDIEFIEGLNINNVFHFYKIITVIGSLGYILCHVVIP